MGMQPLQRYVLGLDLGTASVGWALIRTDDDETDVEIVGLGVRKFSEVYKKGNDPSKKNSTTNKERREARLARRQTRRKRQRRRKTLALLRQYGLAADGSNPFPDLPRCRFSPYDVWARAYTEDLTAYEFGRILYLLAHRRGFKSNLGAGLGKLAEDQTIAAFLATKETEEAEKAIAKAAKGKSRDSQADDKDADLAKTLAQVGHWNQAFATVPMGTLFFALLNPGQNGELLEQTIGSPEIVSALKPVWTRQQVRNKASNPLWARPDRAAYEAEFERLWNRQSQHLGLSDEAKKAIHQALFYQNPLAFPADNRAFCSFSQFADPSTGELVAKVHRAPRCSLLFQEYRIWKLLADLKVKSAPDGEFRHLSLPEKNKAFSLLDTASTVWWTHLKKELGFKNTASFEPEERTHRGEDYSEKGIKGNKIAGWFSRVDPSTDAGDELLKLWEAPERFLTKDLQAEWKNTKKGRRDQVRHHLIRLIGEAPFRQKSRFGSELPHASMERVWRLLKDDFEISNLAAFRLACADFGDGFGNLSYQAMAAILPYLRRGMMEHEARKELQGAVVGEMPWHPEPESAKIAPKPQREDDQKNLRIPSPPDARQILSPRVRKALNQARYVINALYDENPGLSIHEIRIEMARRMQLNNEEYARLLKYQSYNHRMAQMARSEFEKLHSNETKMPEGFVEKFKLAKQAGYTCPYCGGTYGQQLVTEDLEIDHIWPKSIGGDSFSNKVLVHRTCNQAKRDIGPWSMKPDWREAVSKRIEDWPVFTKGRATENEPKESLSAPDLVKDIAKRKVNKVRTSNPPRNPPNQEFAERQAVETGYIAKAACTYLVPAAESVTPIKSTFSTSLAKAWGFYKRLNQVHQDDIGKIPGDKKDRILLRHHAVDALATALCSRKMVARIVLLEKGVEDAREHHTHAEMMADDGDRTRALDQKNYRIREQVKKLQPTAIQNGLSGHLANIVVSHESKEEPKGKFFFEQPLGVTSSHMDTDTMSGLNKWVHVSELKPGYLFPSLTKTKGSGEESENDSRTRGFIKSELTKTRILEHLASLGLNEHSSKEDIADKIKSLSTGVPYQTKKGTRWIRRVLLQVPMDRQENYRIIEDSGGGKTLYPKLERYCAVIGRIGKKVFFETVPLIDAALAKADSPMQFEKLLVTQAASKRNVDVDSLLDVQVFRKGESVRIKKHSESNWSAEIYQIEVLDSAGRLWLRAQWSGDKETKKDKAIGSLIASASVYQFEKVILSVVGKEVCEP